MSDLFLRLKLILHIELLILFLLVKSFYLEVHIVMSNCYNQKALSKFGKQYKYVKCARVRIHYKWWAPRLTRERMAYPWGPLFVWGNFIPIFQIFQIIKINIYLYAHVWNIQIMMSKYFTKYFFKIWINTIGTHRWADQISIFWVKVFKQ